MILSFAVKNLIREIQIVPDVSMTIPAEGEGPYAVKTELV
jgi:hypothetical protein